MYEAPKLTMVGKADEVILGICSVGWDLDTLLMIAEDEFAAVDTVEID